MRATSACALSSGKRPAWLELRASPASPSSAACAPWMAASRGAEKSATLASASASCAPGETPGSARLPGGARAAKRYTYRHTRPSREPAAAVKEARQRAAGGAAAAGE